MPGWGGEFEPEVSSLSSGIHVVVMEEFKGKEFTFMSEWLTRKRSAKAVQHF